MPMPKLVKDWTAPWEENVGEGEDPTFDFDKGKNFLFGVLTDKERLQAQIATLTGERDELKAAADAKDRENETETERLKRERDEAVQRAEESSKTSKETLRLRAAMDVGLAKEWVPRIAGDTEEEILADATALAASVGTKAKKDDDDDEDEETGEPGPSQRPTRRRLDNGIGPDSGTPKFQSDKVADNFLGQHGVLPI